MSNVNFHKDEVEKLIICGNSESELTHKMIVNDIEKILHLMTVQKIMVTSYNKIN